MTLHVKGAKDDKGKLRMGLVISGFIPAILEVCKIGTFGANKYTANGWQEVEKGYDRYEDAMFRHWAAFKMGEKNDPESGFPHLAHFAWNALAILTFYLEGKINGSENCSRLNQSTGSADHDLRAGISEIYPRRADDTSYVQPECTVLQSGASQEGYQSPLRQALDLGKEQGRDVFGGASWPTQGWSRKDNLEDFLARGKTFVFDPRKAWPPQAMGQQNH